MNRAWNNIPFHEAGCVFMLPAKSANTSVKRAIEKFRGGDAITRDDGSLRNVHAYMERWSPERVKASGLYPIAIVRNPYARAISAWWQKLGQPAPGQSSLIKDRRFRAGMSFREYLETAAAIPDEAADIHTRAQVYGMFVGDEFLAREIHKVDRPGWWDSIRDRTGLPDIGTWNASAPPLTPGEMGPYEASLIQMRYAADFEVFGYSRDPSGSWETCEGAV